SRQRTRGPPPLHHRHRGRHRGRRAGAAARRGRGGRGRGAGDVRRRRDTRKRQSAVTTPTQGRRDAAGHRDPGAGRQGEGKVDGRMAAKANGTAIVEKKLVGIADVVIHAAERSRDPALAIPVRSLANVSFNEKRGIIEMGKNKQERSFFNVGMAKKFMQTVLVADALVELQRSDLTTSLREIYYRSKHTMKGSHENTFDAQNESDPLIEDLEVTLSALREELHVRAENGGSVGGPLVLTDDGARADCARLGKGGYSVPSIVEPEFIQIRRCTADFVLLVEKGTQWNRMSEDKFWRRYNCVLLTGNGQPPRGVRRLARRLHEEYKIPVYVLVDNDPWGYYIYSVVKQG